MTGVATAEAAGLAYRECTPEGAAEAATVLCLHGFPQSSYMWEPLLAACAAAGHRAVAPDLPGSGDSPPDPPATWERQVEAVERFAGELDLGGVVLVVHDWGGLIGLRWACDHPGRAAGLVISGTGFFADGTWHGIAQTLRTPGQGEEIVAGLDREGFGAMLKASSSGFDEGALDEYWKALEGPEGRAGVLELYRSGDFEKLAAYEGRLAALALPPAESESAATDRRDWPAAREANATAFSTFERAIEDAGSHSFETEFVRPGTRLHLRKVESRLLPS